jgi:hypothetical protein
MEFTTLDRNWRRKPIPQSFKDALSKLMATKYYTLSGFNRNAR